MILSSSAAKLALSFFHHHQIKNTDWQFFTSSFSLHKNSILMPNWMTMLMMQWNVEDSFVGVCSRISKCMRKKRFHFHLAQWFFFWQEPHRILREKTEICGCGCLSYGYKNFMEWCDAINKFLPCLVLLRTMEWVVDIFEDILEHVRLYMKHYFLHRSLECNKSMKESWLEQRL